MTQIPTWLQWTLAAIFSIPIWWLAFSPYPYRFGYWLGRAIVRALLGA